MHDMTLGDLIKQYQAGTAYQRAQLVAKTLAGFKLPDLRKLLRRAYLDHPEQVVLDGHHDVAYLRKLLGWTVVERSGTLDLKHLEILQRHRSAHIAKGPNFKADPDASVLDLDIKSDERKNTMETVKKNKNKKVGSKKPRKNSTPTTAGNRSRFPEEAKITLLVKENPKRPKSAAAARFALYDNSKTVGEYLMAGGHAGDLLWDKEHKFIAVDAHSSRAAKIPAPKGAAKSANVATDIGAKSEAETAKAAK